MSLKPLGEKIVNILVNGTQEESFTQDETENDYDISVSTDVTQNTGGGQFAPSGESPVWVVVVWAACDAQESAELSWTIEDASGNVLKDGTMTFTHVGFKQFVFTESQVGGSNIDVTTSVFENFSPNKSGHFVKSIASNATVTADNVTQS